MNHAFYDYTTSTVLDAPIAKVWTLVRDIVQLVKVVIPTAEQVGWAKGGSVDKVPAQFQFSLGPDTVLHEEVIGRSESDYSITYRANGQVLTMAEYWATIRLQPITLPANTTFLIYTRRFRFTPGTDPAQALPGLQQIMDGETATLHSYFAHT